jgi:m7GpppX diphosphatase
MSSEGKFNLKIEEILVNNQDLKSCFILCEDEKNQKAVLIVNKLTFTQEQIEKIISKETEKNLIQENDKFSKYQIKIKEETLDLNIIYPATPQDIAKFSKQKFHYFLEDSKIYKEIVRPYVDSLGGVTWIENIFNKKSKEEVLIDGETFMLCPNPKWNKNVVEELNCLAIAKDSTLKSIRDVKDFKYLERIQHETLNYIEKNFNVKSNKIIGYIHYLPTFWHFHIHFCSISSPTFGGDRSIGKAILLNDIIQNLKWKSDYYQDATMTYSLGESHPLTKIFEENKIYVP